MNDQYPIGTICIGQNHILNAEYNNMPCEIIGGLEMRAWREDDGSRGISPCYLVIWADGLEAVCEPPFLRLPPKHKEWADEAIRKLKKQSSDHVAVQLADAIPEEAL